MKAKHLPILLGLLLLSLAGLACNRSTRTRTLSHAEFRFEYPANWQSMSELWGTYQLKEDFYGLGAQELVALTSVRKKGETGIWFSVARKPLNSELFTTLIENTYAQANPEIVERQQSTVQLGGLTAQAFRYRRPWGEPWWEFYDLWVEKDTTAYLLSFHALSLDEFQAEIDLILQSFSFQP